MYGTNIYNSSSVDYSNTIQNDSNGGNYEFEIEATIKGDIQTGFSMEKTFNVIFGLDDNIKSLFNSYFSSKSALLPTAIPAIDIYKSDVSLHGLYNENLGGTQFNGNLFINGNQLGDYIIESGGNYIKYANGTLIQWGSLSVTVAVSTAMGSVYRTSSAQGDTFPVSFYYAPLVIATPHSAINSCYINTQTKTGFTLYPISYTSLSAASRDIYWLAIGRWKSA